MSTLKKVIEFDFQEMLEVLILFFSGSRLFINIIPKLLFLYNVSLLIPLVSCFVLSDIPWDSRTVGYRAVGEERVNVGDGGQQERAQLGAVVRW